MNKFLLIFLLLFAVPVKAQSLQDIKCSIESPLYKFASELADISVEQCMENKAEDSLLDPIVGCIKGHYGMARDTVEGIYAIFKLLLYELPKWQIENMVGEVRAIFGGEMTPSQVVARVADYHVGKTQEMWNTARAFWDATKMFATELKQGLIEHSKGFFCKPQEEQYKIICRAVDEVLLLAIPIGGAGVQGAKWSGTASRSLGNFLRALKESEIKGFASQMDYAAEAVRASNSMKNATVVTAQVNRVVLQSRNGVLKEVTLPSGTRILQYETKRRGPDGKLHTEIREVVQDSKTGAIDANGEVGKLIIADMVQHNRGRGAMLLMDVNDLRLANYFEGGVLTGDKYLSEVGRSVREALRSDDVFFKYGGDELVVIIPESNPEIVRQVSQRISDAVYNNPEIKRLFNSGFEYLIRSHSQLSKVHRYEDLPDSLRMTLKEPERRLAQTNFQEFKRQKLKAYEENFAKINSEGSVSVGATILRANDSAEDAFARANELADLAKARYKASLNQDISKYGTDASIETATVPVRRPRQGPIAEIENPNQLME